MIDVIFINDSNVAAPTLKPKLETGVVYILQTDAPNLTFTTNLAPVFSLPPFAITAFPFNFHYIAYIYFTYHPTLSQNHTAWIESILPILQSLISFFYLKYIFIFSPRDPHDPCPLESLIPLIQSVISVWNISTYFIFSQHLGANVSYFRSFLYLSPIKLSYSSLFIPKSTPSFPNLASWLSSAFNTTHFSHFTKTNLINTSPSATLSQLFFHPKFKVFVQQKTGVIPTIFNSVVDSLHPVPEPSYLSCSTIFDGWFGIPFKDANCFTHVRSPHPTEILRLYGLSCSIPLYPCIIPQHKSKHWFCTSFHLGFYTTSQELLFRMLIHPLSLCLLTSNAFAKDKWEEAYKQDSETKLFLDHLSINAPLDQSTIRTFPAAYRTYIARNQPKVTV